MTPKNMLRETYPDDDFGKVKVTAKDPAEQPMADTLASYMNVAMKGDLGKIAALEAILSMMEEYGVTLQDIRDRSIEPIPTPEEVDVMIYESMGRAIGLPVAPAAVDSCKAGTVQPQPDSVAEDPGEPRTSPGIS